TAIASLVILASLFLKLDLRALLFAEHKILTDKDETIIHALLENTHIEKTKKKKTPKFLSDKDSEARGDLTKEKGFESISNDYVLSPGTRETLKSRIISAKEYTRIITAKESRVHIALPREKKEETTPSTEKLRIPAYYRWRNDFALSWDYAGRPAIPTARYAHYSYFRSMINKIQSVWAPPGGDPYPTFGDSYHRMGPTSGYMRFSTYPSQDIYIQFLLDENGVVRDAKLVSSLGFESLDRSCIEALFAAHDFGPPPAELMEDGTLIVPFIFRIIVR
ncbi:MAG TPA: energy transducer TonB, partial [Turneriella sp.]|nr:energy transducer TonB [Turneriella sp.]